MANDFANSVKTAFITYHQTVRNYSSSWQVLTAAETTGEYTHQDAAIHGLTTYIAQVDSPTPIDVKSSKATTNMAPFERTVKLSLFDIRTNPGILTSIAQSLGMLGGLTLTRAFWTVVKALNSTTHPISGSSYLGQAGGAAGSAVNVVDDFKFFPANAAAFDNQSNLFGLEFGSSAISTMIAQRDEFFDLSGNEIAAPEEQPFVIVPASKKMKARNIMRRTGEIYDGSGLQDGGFQEVTEGVVVPPGKAANDNWFLWWRRMKMSAEGQRRFIGPVRPWMPVPPRITFAESDDSHHIYVKAYMEYAILIDIAADLDVCMSVV